MQRRLVEMLAGPPEELGKVKEVSLSKQLLASLAEHTSSSSLPVQEDRYRAAFELYCRYFSRFCVVEEDINVTCLQRSTAVEKRLRRKLFRYPAPEQEPSFFSFFSHHDCNRAASEAGKELVIYAASDLQAPAITAWIFHDFRGLAASKSNRSILFLLFCWKSQSLHRLSEPLGVSARACFFAGPGPLIDISPRRNFAELVERCLLAGRKIGVPCDKASLPVAGSQAELDEVSSLLSQRWNLERPVVVVTYCRCLKQGSWNAKKQFSQCYLATLCVIPGREAGPVDGASLSESACVVCFWNDSLAGLLSDEFAGQVVARLRDTTGTKEFRGQKISVPGSARLSSSELADAKRLWKLGREAHRRSGKKSKQKAFSKLCRCRLCSSDEFDSNMAASGPERLCSTEYTVSDLLSLLGAWDVRARQTVERLCELSVAAMDIESKTVKVDLGGPAGGTAAFGYREIDSSKLEGHVKMAQHPIMIAHVDARSLSEDRKIFTVDSDAPEACYKMMRQYWNYVLESQRVVQSEKRATCEWIFEEVVRPYRRAFFEEAGEWHEELVQRYKQRRDELEERKKQRRQDQRSGDDDDDDDDVVVQYELSTLNEAQGKRDYNPGRLAAAWKATLPGKLESELDRLIETYEIFTFYG